MPSTPVDVLVIGAGPAGLAVAWGCVQVGLGVAVLEASVDARSGVGLTLWPNAESALRDIGAADHVLARARALPGMSMRTPTGGYLKRIDTDEMVRRCGGVGYALTRGDILASLTSGLPANTIRAGVRAVRIREDSRSAVVDTIAGRMRASVVIGADGDRSVVRTQLWPGERRREIGMRVVRGVSAQVLGDHAAEVTFGRGTQVGVFAMHDGTYWFAAGSRVAVSSKTMDDWLRTLTRWHAPIGSLIRSTVKERMFVNDVWDRSPRRAPWGKGRVTLVGDAAHPSAPTMGQGTCQAFEDAATLVRVLRDQGPTAQALRQYELLRSRRAAGAVRSAHAAAVSGLWEHQVACALRDAGMRVTPRRLILRQLVRPTDPLVPRHADRAGFDRR